MAHCCLSNYSPQVCTVRIMGLLHQLPMTIVAHLHQLPVSIMCYLHHPPLSIMGQWRHRNRAIAIFSNGKDSKDICHSHSYSPVTYLRILLHLRLQPKFRPNLVCHNSMQNQAVPHMYVYNLQTIQEIHMHDMTMTI